MAYDFSKRLDRLGTRMKSLHQNVLWYIDENGNEIQIPNFTPEELDVNQLAAYGITFITDKIQDFIFDTNKLANLTPPNPIIGHKIRWEGNIYDVCRLGTTETDGEIFKYTTSSRKRIRVHTVYRGPA